jgi:hypothetical protein
LTRANGATAGVLETWKKVDETDVGFYVIGDRQVRLQLAIRHGVAQPSQLRLRIMRKTTVSKRMPEYDMTLTLSNYRRQEAMSVL